MSTRSTSVARFIVLTSFTTLQETHQLMRQRTWTFTTTSYTCYEIQKKEDNNKQLSSR